MRSSKTFGAPHLENLRSDRTPVKRTGETDTGGAATSVKSADQLTHNYYSHGLKMHSRSQDNKFKHYFEHLSSSHSTLHEMRYDSCLEEYSPDHSSDFIAQKKFVLALDLDETLVHCCNYDIGERSYHFMVSYMTNKGMVNAKINLRPFLYEFLQSVSKHYDIVIYTASSRDYALAIIDFIDPRRKYIKEIFSREHCYKTKKGYVVKDLRIIMPYELDRVILVDNSVHCFSPQITHGIPILPYFDQQEDDQLFHLLDFLLFLKDRPSLPAYLDRHFQLKSYTAFKRPEDLLSHLSSSHGSED